jgi:hypothetical protein
MNDEDEELIEAEMREWLKEVVPPRKVPDEDMARKIEKARRRAAQILRRR